MNNVNENILPVDKLNPGPKEVFSPEWTAGNPEAGMATDVSRNSGFFKFMLELRRRRVCRAATTYAIVLWLICQVVELVAPALGLPPWTLKMVVLLGLLGFPIVLIFSWMIDITPDGVVIDQSSNATPDPVAGHRPRRVCDKVIDCSLILLALIIGLQLAVGVLAAGPDPDRIAVLPFRVASGDGAGGIAQALVIELQHELNTSTRLRVIAAEERYLGKSTVSLSGAVAVGAQYVRVTARLIDSGSGEVSWSRAFQRPRADLAMTPARFAEEIVAALPAPLRFVSVSETENAT